MRPALFRLSFRPALALCAGLGIFALSTPAFCSSFNTIYTFTPAKDGNAPQAELTQGTDLKLYGTNPLSGPNGNGSVFRVNTTGTAFQSLSSFGPVSTGLQPNGGLVQASDGFFYGTTYGGGANGVGIFYKVDVAGNLTRVASFATAAPGANPAATLVQGIDGYLYGTAQLGGADNYGTVYRADLSSGALATLSTFTAGTDGAYPEGELTQAGDGNFYGATVNGGAANAGTVFRVTPSGTRTTLYTFLGTTDGATPLRGVTLGRDGYLYGAAVKGGALGGGTIFRVATDGTFTVLYSFLAQIGSARTPQGRLVQASDGNFYGTTNAGGASVDAGTIFEVTPTGGFTDLYEFTNGTDDGYPVSGLIQGSDGKLYGTTSGNNGAAAGTIYQLDLGLALPAPQPLLFTPATVSAGDTIMIKGDYFLGATGVTFPTASGAAGATSYTVLSKTMIQAVVPTGAVTGAVTVSNGILIGATPTQLTVSSSTGGGGGGGTGANLPEVTITAPDPVAGEGGANTGKFKFKRAGGDLTRPLTVVMKVKGSATRGEDYNLFVGDQQLATVTNSVTFPAGQKKLTVFVEVIDDTLVEADESVTVKVKPGADYTIGSLNKATVVIADND